MGVVVRMSEFFLDLPLTVTLAFLVGRAQAGRDFLHKK